MYRKFFMLSVLAALVCFSNHNTFASDEKIHQVAGFEQSQTSFEDLPGDLRSLIKKTFYADALSSYDMIKDGKEFKAVNKLQNLEAIFTGEGACVKGTRVEDPWQLDLRLNKFGWLGFIKPVKAGILASNKNRVEIDRGNIKEWFINDQRGLEQGFTIDQPPAGIGSQLVLELSINSDWEALVSQDKRNITLTNDSGQSVDYAGLIAEDARGRALETWFASRKEKDQLICEIQVDVADAQFPILVDPVINETQKILPNDGAAGDLFGFSVDISNETVVVGARHDDDNGFDSGSAYIFVRVGGVWTQQAKLSANDGDLLDFFGEAVSISGETVIVGAPSDEDNGPAAGSAYIFVRSGTTWTQQAKLLPNSSGDFLDFFGESVSISGETVVVGAAGEDNNSVDSGSAYIFVRNGTTWSQQAKLVASDAAANDQFGGSVGISGETVVIAAPRDDDNGLGSGSAYIFVRNGTTWSQQAKLLASDGSVDDQFGGAVDISGETVVIGAPVDGDNGFASGSAYIFVRNGTTWSQQAKLLPSDGSFGDVFGSSVSLSGETAVVGAATDDVNGVDFGSAYVFVRNGTVWAEQVKLLASDGADMDLFGFSVGVSNETAVVGVRVDDDNGTDSGSAAIFDVFCQKDLGFQLGDLSLSICGNDLTQAGSTATLCVSGAAPNSQIFFALGFANNPMPFLGGFVVPFPANILGPFSTDSLGNFTLPLSGGDMNPFTFFLQAGGFDGPVFELSNALEVNIGS